MHEHHILANRAKCWNTYTVDTDGSKKMLSFACAEVILSYHLLPQVIFFTHKLVTVTSLLGGLCWCLLFVCVGFCFWCFVVLFPGVLFFVF